MRAFLLAGLAVFPLVSAVAGVRTQTLADGWMFRLEGETRMRPVRVPHDWAVEGGFLKAGTCPHQGDLPFVGKGFYRRAFDGFTPPASGRRISCRTGHGRGVRAR